MADVQKMTDEELLVLLGEPIEPALFDAVSARLAHRIAVMRELCEAAYAYDNEKYEDVNNRGDDKTLRFIEVEQDFEKKLDAYRRWKRVWQ